MTDDSATEDSANEDSANNAGAVDGGGHSPGGRGTPSTAEFWEDFYRDRGPWTGNPNAALVTELGERPLSAGSALDVACGTGGDAIWLAGRGWAVTGVDISNAALAQGEIAAESAGLAGQIDWRQVDLETDFPEGAWDLVTVAYLHSPVALTRERILRRAASAVASGGTLIVVGHQGARTWLSAPDDHSSHGHSSPGHSAGGHSHQNLPSVDEVLAALDLSGWLVVHTGDVTVTRATPDGTLNTSVDNIIRLRKEVA